ncbi:hypothetical protein M2139_001137 [Enterococcus sp. PF1-24]|uniref:DUF6434 domain-containing protein n=1 Tax=unclassified Enterococcus TaxID=2608891 RepID=UPI002474D869|nr:MULTISPECIES: DUF6434 domain-containing protein [unclassified Enterococcus]MDH6364152.1 hypothetical protein [Enterococcus sp. PFB1-1]MDH6401253.1 hypothetical protein [Enterococcus sp. PF1-24]
MAILNKNMSVADFKTTYFLKTELQAFCKQEALQATGSKTDLTEIIAYYLETGKSLTIKKASVTKKNLLEPLTLTSIIEENFVCSEVHREFFKKEIGKNFSFNVVFQKWLKNNSGKTYQEAISAYQQILAEKKTGKTKINQQFKYNTYIRDFFADNKNRTLKEAITCWNFKKQQKGQHQYAKADLIALKTK